MTNVKRTRFALLAGAVLSIAAGSVAIAAVEPAPPAAPATPADGQRVIIVEKHGGEEGTDYVRTVTRDGKTFVFETDRQLSDAEVEQRIVEAEARIPMVPPVAHGGNRRISMQRVVVMNEKGEDVTDVVTEESDQCAGQGVSADVDNSKDSAGLTRVRVLICGVSEATEKHAIAQAVVGVQQARDEIAGDKDLPTAIRTDILKDLDAELARLTRKS